MEDLESLLARHEGVRRLPYDDATGKPVGPGTIVRGKISVGVGRDFIDTGLSMDEVGYLLRNDIERCRRELDRALPWWRTLSKPRQYVLNLGISALLDFKRWPPAGRAIYAS